MSKITIAAILLFSYSAVCADNELPFDVEEITRFDEPWAMAFLPDGRLLVSEKKGRLKIVGQDGSLLGIVGGLPDVDYGGQGGFGDIVLHPEFENNGLVYVSYAEGGIGGTRGAAVARGRLSPGERSTSLADVEVIWRQYPKLLGAGHYGHRIAFDADGYLWISSGDRQKFTPSQDMQSNVGKLVRLHDDGSVPDDNPFVDYHEVDALVSRGGVYGQIWSVGHRNPLGLAFDVDGQLWEIEMGPAGGDELNRIVRGGNYGYPLVSNGQHYDGRDIPDHDTNPDFIAPAVWWVPAISPGHLMSYTGELFTDWHGDLFAAGLSSQAIIRIEIDGDGAHEAERFEMGSRIRSIVQGPDGALWVLQDERDPAKSQSRDDENRGNQGRLLKLTPRE